MAQFDKVARSARDLRRPNYGGFTVFPWSNKFWLTKQAVNIKTSAADIIQWMLQQKVEQIYVRKTMRKRNCWQLSQRKVPSPNDLVCAVLAAKVHCNFWINDIGWMDDTSEERVVLCCAEPNIIGFRFQKTIRQMDKTACRIRKSWYLGQYLRDPSVSGKLYFTVCFYCWKSFWWR